MAEAIARYERLGLRESLSRNYHYPLACKELSFFLRFAYSKFPKNLQSLIFQDTIAAFRLLPDMQTQSAITAANVLLQGAEAALPKQKKALAATEFRHAMVAHKRRSKGQQVEEGLAHLPEDVLLIVFSFLDFRSLMSAALVCRTWNATSSDNHLWQLQYNIFLNNSDACSKNKLLKVVSRENENCTRLEGDYFTGGSLDWRAVFKKALIGTLSRKYRGQCKHCNTIVWLSDISSEPSGLNCKCQHIEPVSTRQMEYISYRWILLRMYWTQDG